MTDESKCPLIDIIAGARPNFMKIAPIIRALQLRQAGGSRLRYSLIHTGQQGAVRNCRSSIRRDVVYVRCLG